MRGNGTVGLFTKTDSMKNQVAEIDSAVQRVKWHLQDRPRDFFGFSIFGLKAEGYKPTKVRKPHLEATLDSLEDGKKIDYK